MNCNKYMELSTEEKIKFIGKLVHAVQNDNESFWNAEMIIEHAEICGVFENVEILPQQNSVPGGFSEPMASGV